MILFRDVDIETVVPGIKIEDIRVSPIQLSPTARERPIQPGADFVRIVQGTRTVGITFALIEQNMDERRRMIEAVTRWARSSTPQPMKLPFHSGRFLDVICTALPEPSTRQWWESRLSLTFTAFDPFFYSGYEKSAACGMTPFTVAGDAPPRMRIERTLSESLENQIYYSDGHYMWFNITPAGNLVIDLNRQTAEVNGISIMQYWPLDPYFSFIIPRTGTYYISGAGTVKWRERWEA